MVPIYYNIYSIQCIKSSHKDYVRTVERDEAWAETVKTQILAQNYIGTGNY